MKLIYQVYNPGEPGAGLSAYSDTVTVTVESGNPGGEPGEFAELMRQVICDWYDGSRVTLDDTPTPKGDTNG